MIFIGSWPPSLWPDRCPGKYGMVEGIPEIRHYGIHPPVPPKGHFPGVAIICHPFSRVFCFSSRLGLSF